MYKANFNSQRSTKKKNTNIKGFVAKKIKIKKIKKKVELISLFYFKLIIEYLLAQ